jgi:lipid-A-disaccharide synthase
MTRFFVSAGEASGDAYAADVIRSLRQSGCDAEIEGIGGAAMAAAGARLLARSESLSVVGLAEAVTELPSHLRLLRQVARHFAAGRYDLALLVDYPGFHLRVAARATAHGVPVVYYVAPQVWAWGGWRIRALRARVSHLAVVLPFESRFFQEHRIPATFVGHPVLDRPPSPSRDEARRELGLPRGATVLGLFPGSRPAELHRLWPTFRDTARGLRRTIPGLEVVVARAPATTGELGTELGFRHAEARTVFACADAGLCKSGTVTLEGALTDMPMVIAYRVHPITFAFARRLVRVPQVGLVNLLAGSDAVPEFLQRAAVPAELERALLPLLHRGGPAAARQRHHFASIRQALGTPGAARRVAGLALRYAA